MIERIFYYQNESDYNNKMSIMVVSNNIVTGVRNFTSGHSGVVLRARLLHQKDIIVSALEHSSYSCS